jgi:hypothetical protein
MSLPGSRVLCGAGVVRSCPAEAGNLSPPRVVPEGQARTLKSQPAGRRSPQAAEGRSPRMSLPGSRVLDGILPGGSAEGRSSRTLLPGSCRRPRAVGGGDLPGHQRVVRQRGSCFHFLPSNDALRVPQCARSARRGSLTHIAQMGSSRRIQHPLNSKAWSRLVEVREQEPPAAKQHRRQ